MFSVCAAVLCDSGVSLGTDVSAETDWRDSVTVVRGSEDSLLFSFSPEEGATTTDLLRCPGLDAEDMSVPRQQHTVQNILQMPDGGNTLLLVLTFLTTRFSGL